jgi:alpha-galactosidase
VWRKPLADGGMAIALLNRNDQETAITATWKDLGVPANTRLALRDLWQHKDLGLFQDKFSAKVAPNATVLLRATPTTN